MWKRSLGFAAFVAFSAALAAQAPDLPAGAMQQKARTACLECHDPGIILQQRLDRKTWQREVDKMIRWGAVVEPADRDALVNYFFTNFNPDLPPYVPPGRARPKKGGAGSASSKRPPASVANRSAR